MGLCSGPNVETFFSFHDSLMIEEPEGPGFGEIIKQEREHISETGEHLVRLGTTTKGRAPGRRQHMGAMPWVECAA